MKETKNATKKATKKVVKKSKFDVFSNEHLGKVRTMFDPATETVYFHAVDVAECLGHRSAATAVSIHTSPADRIVLNRKDVSPDVAKIFWSSNKGRGQVTFIGESALYKLIMVSRTEVAERFKEWVCGTVLVSIRQNGGYILGQEDLEDQDAIQREIQALREKVLDQADQLVKLKSDNERLQKRRHELIAEVKESKGLRKSLRYMKEDANYWYEMFMLSAEQRDALEEELASLKNPQENVVNPSLTEDKYAILSNGIVVYKSEVKDYMEED